MFSPQIRHHRLKLLFSFMLGVALTAMLFTSSQLHSSRCAGATCGNSWARFRKFIPVATTVISTHTESTSSPTALNASTQRRQLYTSPKSMLPSSMSPSKSSLPTRALNTPSSTFSIPTMKYVARTFPVPSDASYSDSIISRTSKHACTKTEYCEEYLSPKEQTQFSECSSKCVKSSKKYGPVVKGSCKFMNGGGRLPVALASFPGSGNTWTRGLLEKVTGVCTGGLYCDCGLRSGGFTGEGVRGSSVLVMKTHNLKVQFVGGHVFSLDRLPYGAAVLLVRDPRTALVAEWNREKSKRMMSQNVSNHFAHVEQEYFGANKDWDNYIHLKLSRWPQQTVNLLTEAKLAGRPVHILIFEDLKADTVGEMKKVTDFLGFSYTPEEIAARLEDGFSQFYRNHTASFSHFTSDQERYIQDVVYSTSQFMREKGLHDLFPRIDDYI